MKTARHIAVALLLTFFAACAMKKNPEGLRVTIEASAFDSLKKELTPILLAQGFISPDSKGSSTESTVFILGRQPTSSPHLLAFFTREETSGTFVMGKITSDFTDAEVAMIDECSAAIISHADVIVSGRLSTAASTPVLRQKFYAKIKKS